MGSDDGVKRSESLGFVRIHKKIEKATVRKLDLFRFSGGRTHTLLCPLEGTNLNHWTTYVSINT
jgi:hypothetical protein